MTPANFRYVVTLGDPNGISAEIILKYAAKNKLQDFILFADKTVIDFWSSFYKIPYSFEVEDIGGNYIPEISKVTVEAGKSAYNALCEGWKYAKSGNIPLVTLPLSKEAVAMTHKNFKGHTETLAHLDGKMDDDISMILGGERMKVLTLTRHISIKEVSSAITEELIIKQINIINKWFSGWKKVKPEIWIAGLNPHAGENGVIGTEENDIIIPAIKKLQHSGINVKGPFPADTMFVKGLRENVDIMVSCYHDQGLAPLKLIHFDDGVNVTAGLSIIRTSVDHGTAFDIAGKGLASTQSFETAVNWALEMMS